MLWVGPPQIWMEVVPFIESVFALDGSVIRSGVGDVIVVIAATAVADTVVAAGPKNFINVVLTLRDTVT